MIACDEALMSEEVRHSAWRRATQIVQAALQQSWPQQRPIAEIGLMIA